MAAEIAEQLGVQATLIVGVRGVFDVMADGKLVFSKDVAGRFPDTAEIVQALRKQT